MEPGTHDSEPRREGVGSSWVSALRALRDAVEQTVDELRVRGDASSDRAREAVRSTMRRAQDAVDDARERMDTVPRREFEELRREVEMLRRRVAELEGGLGGGTATPPPPDIPVDFG